MILLFLAPSSLQYVISTRSDSGTFTTRKGATGVYYNGAIYVMGGNTGSTYYSDVVKFNINTNVWTSVTTSGTAFTARYGHTATLYNDVIYVIGGYNGAQMNSVYKFTIATSVWASLSSTGFSVRTAHSATLYNDNIYVIGGYSGSSYLSDVVKYSITSNSWTTITTNGATFNGKEGHSATLYKDEIYVIGCLLYTSPSPRDS